VTSIDYSRLPIERAQFEMGMRDGREISVSYWVRKGDPTKAAVVILPGLDEQALAWRRILSRFCWRDNHEPLAELKDRTVVIINQRGQGPTRESELVRYGVPPRTIPRSDQIGILREVMDRLPLQEVILAGHSYGASTALGTLSDDELRPRVHSLVLLAPHVSHFERFTTDRFMQFRVQAAAWLELFNPFAFELGTAAYLPVFFNQHLRNGHLSPFTREWTESRIAFLTAMTMGLLPIDTRSDLASLTDNPLTVHLMIAEHDALVPEGAHQFLYDLLPQAAKGRFIKPPGTTHRLHHNAPEEVVRLFADVASECDRQNRNAQALDQLSGPVSDERVKS
jgi:pimeloyl-ACP methyl ester carboxylesterase